MIKHFLLFLIFLSGVYLQAYPEKYEVVSDKINIRIDSTVSSQSLGYLKKGEDVKVVGENFEWYKIVLPPRFTCWTASQFLTKLETNKYSVNANVLNLRTKASTQAPIVGKVKKDAVLILIKESNGWSQVKAYPYQFGWINKKFLKKIDETKLPELITKHSAIEIAKLMRELETADSGKINSLYSKLARLNSEDIPQLEPYLQSLKPNVIYPLVLTIERLAKQANYQPLYFLEKIESRNIIQSAAYLDIAQSLLKSQQQLIPYCYLAYQKILTPEIIDRIKTNLIRDSTISQIQN